MKGSKMLDISMQDIRWIGFDLDDTLHHFRRASGQAAHIVYQDISTKFSVPVVELSAAYQAILKRGQSGHFAEGKSAKEYRTERFGLLLAAYPDVPASYVETIVDLYDQALAQHLKLKDGAMAVLQSTKAAKLKIAVITEGPQDAQETTLQRLGITSYVDLLVTSAQEKLSKSEGLLQRALDKVGCPAASMLYIGDSLERDILPARKIGIPAILLSEQAENVPDGVVRVGALTELLDLIGGGTTTPKNIPSRSRLIL
jgi:putative hydrolase of the HAD superfamily